MFHSLMMRPSKPVQFDGGAPEMKSFDGPGGAELGSFCVIAGS